MSQIIVVLLATFHVEQFGNGAQTGNVPRGTKIIPVPNRAQVPIWNAHPIKPSPAQKITEVFHHNPSVRCSYAAMPAVRKALPP